MDLNACRQNQRPNSWEKQHNNPQVIHTENPKIEKNPLRGSCVDKNALFMSEVRGEWADWLEMI